MMFINLSEKHLLLKEKNASLAHGLTFLTIIMSDCGYVDKARRAVVNQAVKLSPLWSIRVAVVHIGDSRRRLSIACRAVRVAIVHISIVQHRLFNMNTLALPICPLCDARFRLHSDISMWLCMTVDCGYWLTPAEYDYEKRFLNSSADKSDLSTLQEQTC